MADNNFFFKVLAELSDTEYFNLVENSTICFYFCFETLPKDHRFVRLKKIEVKYFNKCWVGAFRSIKFVLQPWLEDKWGENVHV